MGDIKNDESYRDLPNRELLTSSSLFEAVQAFRIFPDSKTFPDLVPKSIKLDEDGPCEELRKSFKKELNRYFTAVSYSLGELLDDEHDIHGFGLPIIKFRSALETFVTKHFDTLSVAPASEQSLSHGPTSTMEAYIERVWDVLTRDTKTLPAETFNSTLYPLPYPYVVAGGRFNEIYYWDGYFTGEGLVLSGKTDLFECMVKNYAWFIKHFGFVPNGNRTYYRSRSQPPFYCFMVDILVRERGFAAVIANKDPEYVRMLEKEYEFWMGGDEKKRIKALERDLQRKESVVDVDCPKSACKVKMNRYWDDAVSPRPEAYHQDSDAFARTKLSESKSKNGINDFFRHIRAAAESGWDFSSRWFRPEQNEWGRTTREITNIRTTDIIPVDLNSLLYFVEIRLSDWKKDDKYKDKYKKSATRRKQAMLELFWDDELGWFFDYDFKTGSRTDVWSLAGAYPLFCRLFDRNDKNDQDILKRMVDALKKRFLKPGGVVTTLFHTDQQWDYPNGWAPLQWIVVRGLLNYDEHDLALDVAKRFTECVGKAYDSRGRIMEKYNVCDINLIAGGGEYEIQHGFGWTNGVIKAFMTLFRADMEKDNKLAKYLG